MLDNIMDMEFWTEPTAWGVGTIVWMIFMYIMWGQDLLVSQHASIFSKVFISVAGFPLMYIVAKMMLDKGG